MSQISSHADVAETSDARQPVTNANDGTGDPLAGRPWTRSDAVWAAVVGLLVVALGLVFRTEIVTSDPWRYVFLARNFPSDDWAPLGYTRYGMVLPVGPLVALFGNVQLTYYFWPLLASGVLAASLFLIGARWWGRVAGLTAVGLLVTNWVVFINLSRGYPDVISSAIVVTALAVAVGVRGRIRSGGRGVTVLLLLVGALLGWSFEARETALFMWVPVIVVLWVTGRVVRNAVLVALPVLAWAALDMAISAVAYGDWLLKLHTYSRQDLSQATNESDVNAMAQFVGRSREFYLTFIPRLLWDPETAPPGGLWVLATTVLALFGLALWARRHRSVLLMAASFATCYLLFVGIGGMFLPAHPAGRLDVQRYWVQFVPYLALAAAGVLAAATRRLPVPWRAVVAGVAGLVLVAGAGAATFDAATTNRLIVGSGGSALSEVRDVLAAEPESDADVWTDWRTARLLPVYQRGPFGGDPLWTFEPRKLSGEAQPQPGDYVLLVNTERTPCPLCARALSEWSDKHPTVPSDWTPVHVTEGGGMTLYRVGG